MHHWCIQSFWEMSYIWFMITVIQQSFHDISLTRMWPIPDNCGFEICTFAACTKCFTSYHNQNSEKYLHKIPTGSWSNPARIFGIKNMDKILNYVRRKGSNCTEIFEEVWRQIITENITLPACQSQIFQSNIYRYKPRGTNMTNYKHCRHRGACLLLIGSFSVFKCLTKKKADTKSRFELGSTRASATCATCTNFFFFLFQFPNLTSYKNGQI